MKQYLIVLISSWIAIIAFFLLSLNSEPAPVLETAPKIDSIIKVKDSLHMELMPCEIELNRHRVAFEIFMTRNPKAAEQYGTIISEETE